MRLYSRQRVEETENTEEWIDEHNCTERRRAIAAKATATKKANLLAQLDDVEITVPHLSIETLTTRACNHYNERKFLFSIYRKNSRYADYDIATPQSRSEFLARITVNYLRHGLTS
jgi:hypothetical protein